jgi:hypothetical protein
LNKLSATSSPQKKIVASPTSTHLAMLVACSLLIDSFLAFQSHALCFKFMLHSLSVILLLSINPLDAVPLAVTRKMFAGGLSAFETFKNGIEGGFSLPIPDLQSLLPKISDPFNADRHMDSIKTGEVDLLDVDSVDQYFVKEFEIERSLPVSRRVFIDQISSIGTRAFQAKAVKDIKHILPKNPKVRVPEDLLSSGLPFLQGDSPQSKKD